MSAVTNQEQATGPNNRIIKYKPAGPTVRDFCRSQQFVRGIRGPLGSGKSTGCVVEILRRSQAQRASPIDGKRKTRWAIIRNSYPELKTTTLKTWSDWCPQEYGRLTMDSPIRHFVDEPTLQMEVLFLALDRPEDQRKLLSLELTGAWINEAREIPRAILDALTGRVGRYPSKMQGGCSWSGILMDTNPPDDQHWWYHLAEDDTPEGYEFFEQPGGMSPEAENKENLPDGYYERIRAGKDPDWVKVYVDGEYGFVTEGKAVYPMFRDRIHVAEKDIDPVPDCPILIGADFGLTPSAIIGQKLVDGRWLILDELITDSCGTIRFAENLKTYIVKHYADFEVGGAWGDPAGNQRAHSDERTAFEIMKEYTYKEWNWKAAPNNEFFTRREIVVNTLNRLVDGNPGLLVSPKCRTIRKGFAGGYHFSYITSGNGIQVHESPKKNEYSHPHDALQYLLLGAGEYDVSITRKARRKIMRERFGNNKPRMAKDLDFDVFS